MTQYDAPLTRSEKAQIKEIALMHWNRYMNSDDRDWTDDKYVTQKVWTDAEAFVRGRRAYAVPLTRNEKAQIKEIALMHWDNYIFSEDRDRADDKYVAQKIWLGAEAFVRGQRG